MRNGATLLRAELWPRPFCALRQRASGTACRNRDGSPSDLAG